MSFCFHDWIKRTYTRTEVLLSHNLPEYTRLCYLPLWESRKLKCKFIQTKGENNPTVLLQVMLPKREEKFSENTTIIRRLILILTKEIQWNILIGVTLLSSDYSIALSAVWFYCHSSFVSAHWSLYKVWFDSAHSLSQLSVLTGRAWLQQWAPTSVPGEESGGMGGSVVTAGTDSFRAQIIGN